MSVACHRCPVPQKWIGSSVALGFDAGQLPQRSTSQSSIRRRAIVSIFDWGRSELNTLERHDSLTDDEQRDRAEYWQYYSGGIYRLSWEAARTYYHRFGNAKKWKTLCFSLFDYDSQSNNDFMCSVEVPVEPTEEKTVTMALNNRLIKGLGDSVAKAEKLFAGKEPLLTYSITWLEHPSTSRLVGTWRVTLIRAAKIPHQDLLHLKSTSDPFCQVVAMSVEDCIFRQQSSVKARTLSPEWRETFDLPIARSSDALQAALATAGLHLEDDLHAAQMFPPERSAADLIQPRSGVCGKTMSKMLGSLKPHQDEDPKQETALVHWFNFLETADFTRVVPLQENQAHTGWFNLDGEKEDAAVHPDVALVSEARTSKCGCSSEGCCCM